MSLPDETGAIVENPVRPGSSRTYVNFLYMGSLYLVEQLARFKSNLPELQDQFHSLSARARLFAGMRYKMAKPKLRNIPNLSTRATPGETIAVRVTPKAAKDSIVIDSGTIRISVTVPPENGKANDAVRRILAAAMGVAPSDLTLKQGQSARDKLFVYTS